MRVAHVLLIALALPAAALAQPLAQGPAEPGSSVESLLAYARVRNPEVAAMRHEAEAAAQRIVPAGALPDPVIRTELQNITNAGSPDAPSLWPARVGSTRYLFMQPVPFPGKRGLREAAARADADQAGRRADAAWVEVAARIRAEHAQHWYLGASLKLAEEILELAASLESIALARYAGGLVPQQDAIRAQLERTAMRTELVAMQAERRQALARLNALLTRPPAAPLPEPEPPAALPAPEQFAPQALYERARQSNPELDAEAARLRAAGAGRDLAYRNRFPDFTFGVAPVQTGSRIGMWELMVEMNIPLQQQSRRAQEREADAMVASARARADAAANRIRGEIEAGATALEAAREAESIATSRLLPQAQLALKAALVAYESGKVDFSTVLEAQRELRKARQAGLRARLDGQLRLAEIGRLVGEAP